MRKVLYDMRPCREQGTRWQKGTALSSVLELQTRSQTLRCDERVQSIQLIAHATGRRLIQTPLLSLMQPVVDGDGGWGPFRRASQTSDGIVLEFDSPRLDQAIDRVEGDEADGAIDLRCEFTPRDDMQLNRMEICRTQHQETNP